MENNTTHQPYTHYTVCGVGIAISLMAITGNIANLLVIPRLPNVSDTYKFLLISLAVTDLLTGLFIFPYLLYSISLGPYDSLEAHGRLWCRLVGYILPWSALGDVAIVLCVAIYKYISITRPLHSAMYVTKEKASAVVGMLMILLAVLLGFCSTDESLLEFSTYEPRFGLCIISFGNPRLKIWTTVIFTVSVFLPAILVCSMYAHIAVISRKQAKRIAIAWASTTSNNTTGNRLRQTTVASSQGYPVRRLSEWRGLKSALLLTFGFLVAWIPFSVMYLLLAYEVTEIPHALFTIIGNLVSSTAWWNCIVYSLCSKDFRHTAVTLIQRVCHRFW